MPVNEIFNVVLPTFAAIMLGFALGKTIKIDMTGVVDIVFYIGLPALAFVSILSRPIILIEAAKIWGSAIIVTFGCGLLGWLFFKIKKENHSGLYLPISLPNTVNIPFPIISLAYGSAGLLAATLYYIPNIILTYSLGVFIATGKSWSENLKAMLRVPTMYAAILALIINLFDISVPTVILRPIEFISSIVIPLVLLTLGYSLSKIKVTSIPTTLQASVIRIGGGLALGFLVTYLFNITDIHRSVVILISSMPAAVNTYLVAAKYKNETELVASVVFVTTVTSLLLIPLLLNILG